MRDVALPRLLDRAALALLGREAALVAVLAAATALSAHVRFPLPFTPVPVTLQTFMVLVAGGLLGARLGSGSQLVYLALASVGLPIIAGPTLFGPTGGYLLGFVAAAAIMGYAARRGGWAWLAGGAAVATVAIWTCGAAWLCLITGQPLKTSLLLGVAPFIAGDVVKAIAALAVIQAGRPLITRTLNR